MRFRPVDPYMGPGFREHPDYYREEPEVVPIPEDGKKHTCPLCDSGCFYVWDCDGWAPSVIIDDNRADVDCSGITTECPNCGVEFEIRNRLEDWE